MSRSFVKVFFVVLFILFLQIIIIAFCQPYIFEISVLLLLLLFVYTWITGKIDRDIIVSFLKAPLKALWFTGKHVGIVFSFTVLAVVLIYSHEYISIYPAIFIIAITLAFLVEQLKQTYVLSQDVHRLITDIDCDDNPTKHKVAYTLRKQKQQANTALNTHTIQAEVEKIIKEEDPKNDIDFNLPAWQVAWYSLFFIVNCLLCFRIFFILFPDTVSFDESSKGNSVILWVVFALREIIMDDPFELLNIEGFIQNFYGTKSIQVNSYGYGIPLIALRVGVSVFLIGSIMLHLQMSKGIKKLLKLSGEDRLFDLENNRYFQRLLILRPFAESILLKTLKNEIKKKFDKPKTLSCDSCNKTLRSTISLLKSKRAVAIYESLYESVEVERIDFQTKLALCIKLNQTRDKKISKNEIIKLLPEVFAEQEGELMAGISEYEQQTVHNQETLCRYLIDLKILSDSVTCRPYKSETWETDACWYYMHKKKWPKNWKSISLNQNAIGALWIVFIKSKDKDVLIKLLLTIPHIHYDSPVLKIIQDVQDSQILSDHELESFIFVFNELILGYRQAYRPLDAEHLKIIQQIDSHVIDDYFIALLNDTNYRNIAERKCLISEIALAASSYRSVGVLIKFLNLFTNSNQYQQILSAIKRLTKKHEQDEKIVETTIKLLLQEFVDRDIGLSKPLLQTILSIGANHKQTIDLLAGCYKKLIKGNSGKSKLVWNVLSSLSHNCHLVYFSKAFTESIKNDLNMVFRAITLDGRKIFIQNFPVTIDHWNRIMVHKIIHADKTDVPVTGITYQDCLFFCHTLTDYLKDGIYRLPRLEEWEYCFEQGENLNIPGSERNVDNKPSFGPSPMAEYAADSNGIFDLVGNVWERIQIESHKDRHVIIGGCWNTNLSKLNKKKLLFINNSIANPRIGFRLAFYRY